MTQIIDMGPGQQKQGVHRGNGLRVHDMADDGLRSKVEEILALTGFTEEHSAAHVIPGSRGWQVVIFDTTSKVQELSKSR